MLSGVPGAGRCRCSSALEHRLAETRHPSVFQRTRQAAPGGGPPATGWGLGRRSSSADNSRRARKARRRARYECSVPGVDPDRQLVLQGVPPACRGTPEVRWSCRRPRSGADRRIRLWRIAEPALQLQVFPLAAAAGPARVSSANARAGCRLQRRGMKPAEDQTTSMDVDVRGVVPRRLQDADAPGCRPYRVWINEVGTSEEPSSIFAARPRSAQAAGRGGCRGRGRCRSFAGRSESVPTCQGYSQLWWCSKCPQTGACCVVAAQQGELDQQGGSNAPPTIVSSITARCCERCLKSAGKGPMRGHVVERAQISSSTSS